ncbi:MAG: recombination mediator RecR [Alphaproteobacteria bacterium]
MKNNTQINKLIKIISKLPSLGQRSSRRIVLSLLKRKEDILIPLIASLKDVNDNLKTCEICGNYDTETTCHICRDLQRDSKTICVVADVSDLWAIERAGLFKGKYHILGGILSALEGVTPQDLSFIPLFNRIEEGNIQEIIIALPATIDGQITSHYIVSKLKETDIKITTLAQGIPLGAELDYMDEGTIGLAFKSRKDI